MSGQGEDAVEGVLVVDKPRGPTSHDVVSRMRRALGTRRIGHAGTLDPMASGVLVILVGEATKLAGYLTAHDKRYVARVALGAGTDTLDAEGEVTETGAIPGWLAGELGALAAVAASEKGLWAEGEVAARAPGIAAAIAGELGRREQVPPAHSAIQVGGQRSYALARAGREVELPARPVEVRALSLRGVTLGSETQGAMGAMGAMDAMGAMAEIEVEIEVTKGYYVRSLARDLGVRLGVPAHLTALRRTASGAFTIDRALSPDAGSEALRAALLPVAEAAAIGLPTARLTEAGARRARQGQRITVADFEAAPPVGAAQEEPAAAAWLAPDGGVVAVGSARMEGGEPRFSVLRGFSGSRAVEQPDS